MGTPNSTYQVACLSGDGVGPEIMTAALHVLEAASKKYDFSVSLTHHAVGGSAIDQFENPLPDATLEACKNSNAVLLGAVGGPKWDNCPPTIRPEAGLLKLRKELGLFCNLRPVKTFAPLISACPLKSVNEENPIDFMIVRELTGGIYFGKRGSSEGENPSAWDIETYSENEVMRIAKTALGLAKNRRQKLTSIDKANVLESSRLWRRTVSKIAATSEYETLNLEHQYVDNCAMQLILNPHQFDVVLTNNIFGDILSDEASTLVGSIGLMPSASLGEANGTSLTHFGLYEPIHGSAPDIAGQGKANPTGMILSIAMMLRHSLNEEVAARAIETAVDRVFYAGITTPDLKDCATTVVDTQTFAAQVVLEMNKY